ncbi:hypothetical protein SAMN05216298_4606 [Glycomyces sambucus]|uniref:Uncharacterized protein n=1 Tax=Glycomyces sambucus TaxID=380244 RepID=A0A1G9LNA3_9ACTN|nr:hypothetical protein [Glycomyces sambucus]SDL63005.1 hypothetical protein SAMN05216298_4606 [Glycomyces sambucus]
MHAIYDVAAMLALAAGLALLILLVLRLLAPAAVRRRDVPRPTRAARIESWVVPAVFLLAMAAVGAAQVAYGSPAGERGPVPVEVLEVGECERPVAGLGLVVACDLSGWSATVPSDRLLADGERFRVLGGEPVEAGDRVVRYRLAWWESLPMIPDPQWRSVADESRPDLRWTSVLPVVGLLGYGLSRRVVGRRAAVRA